MYFQHFSELAIRSILAIKSQSLTLIHEILEQLQVKSNPDYFIISLFQCVSWVLYHVII